MLQLMMEMNGGTMLDPNEIEFDSTFNFTNLRFRKGLHPRGY